MRNISSHQRISPSRFSSADSQHQCIKGQPVSECPSCRDNFPPAPFTLHSLRFSCLRVSQAGKVLWVKVIQACLPRECRHPGLPLPQLYPLSSVGLKCWDAGSLCQRSAKTTQRKRIQRGSKGVIQCCRNWAPRPSGLGVTVTSVSLFPWAIRQRRGWGSKGWTSAGPAWNRSSSCSIPL